MTLTLTNPNPTPTLTLTKELDAYAALTREDTKDHHALRVESQDDLHGNVFYSFGLLIAEAAVHLVVVTGLCYGLDMPHYALPGSIKFPGSELESFLAIWNPLCLSSIMAFARWKALTLARILILDPDPTPTPKCLLNVTEQSQQTLDDAW